MRIMTLFIIVNFGDAQIKLFVMESQGFLEGFVCTRQVMSLLFLDGTFVSFNSILYWSLGDF